MASVTGVSWGATDCMATGTQTSATAPIADIQNDRFTDLSL